MFTAQIGGKLNGYTCRTSSGIYISPTVWPCFFLPLWNILKDFYRSRLQHNRRPLVWLPSTGDFLVWYGIKFPYTTSIHLNSLEIRIQFIMSTYGSFFLLFMSFVIIWRLLEIEGALELNKLLSNVVFNSNLFIKFSLIHSSPILSQNNWMKRKGCFRWKIVYNFIMSFVF